MDRSENLIPNSRSHHPGIADASNKKWKPPQDPNGNQLPQDHRNESWRQEDEDAVFTLVCEDEIVKQPLASSPSQAKRILERKSLVDHLSFVVQRKMKLFFVDEAQLMSKEQWSLAW